MVLTSVLKSYNNKHIIGLINVFRALHSKNQSRVSINNTELKDIIVESICSILDNYRVGVPNDPSELLRKLISNINIDDLFVNTVSFSYETDILIPEKITSNVIKNVCNIVDPTKTYKRIDNSRIDKLEIFFEIDSDLSDTYNGLSIQDVIQEQSSRISKVTGRFSRNQWWANITKIHYSFKKFMIIKLPIVGVAKGYYFKLCNDNGLMMGRELTAIVAYNPPSHYTAYVKYDQWYHYDDNHVTGITGNEPIYNHIAKSHNMPYILFYSTI